MPIQTVGDLRKQLARYKNTSVLRVVTQTQPVFAYDIKNLSSTSEHQIQHLFDDEEIGSESVVITIALRPPKRKKA
ncbi:MAG: hypothetical protein HY231_24060 [Acidobacteria bacterium]|nr:hypothetical protein [Acidobacteriota bacterium]